MRPVRCCKKAHVEFYMQQTELERSALGALEDYGKGARGRGACLVQLFVG